MLLWFFLEYILYLLTDRACRTQFAFKNRKKQYNCRKKNFWIKLSWNNKLERKKIFSRSNKKIVINFHQNLCSLVSLTHCHRNRSIYNLCVVQIIIGKRVSNRGLSYVGIIITLQHRLWYKLAISIVRVSSPKIPKDKDILKDNSIIEIVCVKLTLAATVCRV